MIDPHRRAHDDENNADEEALQALGAERSDDRDDHSADDPKDDELDLDLAVHGLPEREAADPVPRIEPQMIDMGVRHVARSGDGLTVINTIEVLPPWDLSV